MEDADIQDEEDEEESSESQDKEAAQKEEISELIQAALVPITFNMKAQNALLKKQNRLVVGRLNKMEGKENNSKNMVASLGEQVEYLVRVG
jgi:hypothetical protein